MHRFVIALVLAAVVAFGPGLARADGDAVALLPLEADKTLELYGQPVASEIARVLVVEHVDVVVVGPKNVVPERARLIVDGTISGGKGSEPVHLAVRIRDRVTAATLAKLSADAPTLTNIDSAAAQLAKDVLHAVQEQLAKKPAPPPPPDKGAETSPRPAPPATHALRIAVAAGALQELNAAANEWASQHHWTAGGADSEATIALDPLSYDRVDGRVPMARARVRVRISDKHKTLKFDRIVVTDTVVGEKDIPPAQLAARVAREVLAIVEPHMQRAIASWK